MMRSKVASGGRLIASIRDHDAVLRDRPQGTVPRLLEDARGRRVVVQAWEWRDERRYRAHLFILTEAAETGGEDPGWSVTHRTVAYRAVTRAELGDALSRAGFAGHRWLFPEETGLHQPLVVAR